MVGVSEERIERVPILWVDAPKSITWDDLDARNVCAPKVDRWDYFHASYSLKVKLI